MADARALLRSQRETRRINHPHASYTGSGRLLCTVCNTTIKSEQFWPNHLRNPDHAARIQKLQNASNAQSNKKRKADDDDDETSDVDEGRKRMKATDRVVETPVALKTVSEEPVVEERLAISKATTQNLAEENTATSTKTAPAEEEDAEWLELQRAINSSDVPSSKPSIPAAATISAPAMSAEEIAAQAREEQSVQRGRRDEELVAEKEDAVRALQDEFQEMEELEDRVRKLREKREALRVGGAQGGAITSGITTNGETTTAGTADTKSDENQIAQSNNETEPDGGVSTKNVEEEDDDDDDEDFDDWTFGVQ